MLKKETTEKRDRNPKMGDKREGKKNTIERNKEKKKKPIGCIQLKPMLGIPPVVLLNSASSAIVQCTSMHALLVLACPVNQAP